MNKYKITPQKNGKSSRELCLAMANLLHEFGYVVHIDREKQGNKSTWVWFVEYWGD